MMHYFNVDTAIKHGVDEAIILNFLEFWISKNKANNRHFYEGKFWTYNSIKAFTELFPYYSEKQIRRILKSLEDKKLVVVGDFNKSNYDRTKWYSIMDNSSCPNGQMEITERANGFSQTGEPIPVNNTFNNTFNKYIYLGDEKIFDLIEFMKTNLSIWLNNQKIEKLDSKINEFQESFIEYQFKDLNHLRNAFRNFLRYYNNESEKVPKTPLKINIEEIKKRL